LRPNRRSRLTDIAALTKAGQIALLLQVCAQFAGQLTNFSETDRNTSLDSFFALPRLEVIAIGAYALGWQAGQIPYSAA
jgi:hypothetical protein